MFEPRFHPAPEIAGFTGWEFDSRSRKKLVRSWPRLAEHESAIATQRVSRPANYLLLPVAARSSAEDHRGRLDLRCQELARAFLKTCRCRNAQVFRTYPIQHGLVLNGLPHVFGYGLLPISIPHLNRISIGVLHPCYREPRDRADHLQPKFARATPAGAQR